VKGESIPVVCCVGITRSIGRRFRAVASYVFFSLMYAGSGREREGGRKKNARSVRVNSVALAPEVDWFDYRKYWHPQNECEHH